MLQAMANLIRPATERRSTRQHKSPSPPPAEVATSPQRPQQQPPATILTRRASKANTLPPREHDKPHANITKQPSPVRSSARKRSLAEANAPDARPPVKITQTRPHGELLGITNGVPKKLKIDGDHVPSGASTPKPFGARLTVPDQTPSAATDKRSLRSQDGGSRLKSDLATYFSSYDDIIAGVEKPSDFLDVDTRIYIVDEPVKGAKAKDAAPPASLRSSASPSRSRKSRAHPLTRNFSQPSIPPASSASTSYKPLDYSSLAGLLPQSGNEDPLADSVYFAQHRRAERKEKQLRNIEKERAMHEKMQLERLLDGLQGPDWLKVMGITGVTDGERKDWEPKRDFFIKEVEMLVDKFRLWKEQEKKLRADKEAASAAREEEEEESESESEPRKVNGKTPAPSLPHPKHPEHPKPRRPPQPHGFLLPLIPPEPTGPFTSFYSKPHLRAAALGKHRHGRNASAFGRPIPEWEEHEFELPEEFVTPEFLRDNARKRRRRKRESVVES